MITLLFTLAIVLPSQRVVEIHVDLIEVNTTFDARGNRTFTQVIFWERCPATGRMKVRSWKMLDSDYPLQTSGLYRMDYRADGVEYRIRSRGYRESFTHNDPERDDSFRHPIRNAFPKARASE